mmetsp:Transcript_3344/g.7446  ORF Transcript_3344/g.7446 Transcript_3344/m.7446 type:complete len:141 (+) Transcript_3344:87-509(+)
MAAALDMSTLAETSQEVAFEIDIKSASGATIMTSTRARLQARQVSATNKTRKVSRRTSTTKSVDGKEGEESVPTPIKEVAEKAKERNEKRAEAVERIRQKQEENLKSLWEALSTAAEQAGKHFESVIAKAALFSAFSYRR